MTLKLVRIIIFSPFRTLLHFQVGSNPMKATYLDNGLERFCRNAAEVITPRLTRVINLDIKAAKWVKAPLHKNGHMCDSGNYNLVSFISVLSLVMEKLINEYKLESDFSFLHTHAIVSHSERGERRTYCGMITLDAQVELALIFFLPMLNARGFTWLIPNWVQSFLPNQTYVLDVNGTINKPRVMLGYMGYHRGACWDPWSFYCMGDLKAHSCNVYFVGEKAQQ